MGNKAAKKGAPKIASKDMKFLHSHTGMSEAEINQIFSDFMANNPDGQLNQTEFVVLYDKLRAEPYQSLDEISKYVFNVFDKVIIFNFTINFNCTYLIYSILFVFRTTMVFQFFLIIILYK